MMQNATILVIEDEKNITTLLKYTLEAEGFHVFTATRGDEGLSMVRQNRNIQLLLLDLMIPGMSGIEVCKAIRSDGKIKHIPILMLTAKSSETDKVVGLEMGADDYMTKPFSTRELVARVKALLRRTSSPNNLEHFHVGTLQINTQTHEVFVDGQSIGLTSKEYRLLKLLVESDGKVLSREELLTKVWGYDRSLNIETRTIDIHIASLRKKLRSESWRILTLTNEGYRFNLDV